MKRWSEVMGYDVPEVMLRTTYVGILDPTTRFHLTNFHGGKETKPDTLKQEILKFVSNAVVDSKAMQVGSVGVDEYVSAADGTAGSSHEQEDFVGW